MKRILIFSGLSMILAGCFSLKTPLPYVEYYDLDIPQSKYKQCQKPVSIAIANIQSAPIYNTTEILSKKQDGSVKSLPNLGWVDLPKNLIKKNLIKTLNHSCVKTLVAPFGGVKYDYLLKAELLNFEVVSKDNKEVWVALFYEFSRADEFQIIQSNVIEKRVKVKNNQIIEAFSQALDDVIGSLMNAIESKYLKNK
ncbi:hypothetical protein BBW65_04825 [Helicobacter enhydrae]|uniref:ABC-type transport auxiliary lipoprotein component domain-containing protein n=1 Tax=Helicobacter enhydrae TaxID=222136 RepID=A0A1B1U5V6_9HELI|nr:ABC-type transport auxiliary lipoprotein family protein [Helicobacter enhydrae]ANV98163.1 hypothetical protein BBW65_04825 [Helicobacter enhydrae]